MPHLFQAENYSWLTDMWNYSIICHSFVVHEIMKKRSEETETLHAGCSQKLLPRCRSLPRVQDSQNLITCRWSLPLPTNPFWWGSMHAFSSYRGNRPTYTHTHTQTGLITVHCTAASVQCNKVKWIILKHIVRYSLLKLHAVFNGNLLTTFEVIAKRHFIQFWGLYVINVYMLY